MKRRRFGAGKLLAVAAVFLVAIGLIGSRLFAEWLYPLEYQEYIEQYSEEYGLSPGFVCGVIFTESRFRPGAVSSIGARGLMQITEETFEWTKGKLGDRETSYEDLFNPRINIRYGTRLLSLLLEEFGGEREALAAYHAGWGNVKKWLADREHSADGVELDSIPFGDTARYIPKVLQSADLYRRLYGLD